MVKIRLFAPLVCLCADRTERLCGRRAAPCWRKTVNVLYVLGERLPFEFCGSSVRVYL